MMQIEIDKFFNKSRRSRGSQRFHFKKPLLPLFHLRKVAQDIDSRELLDTELNQYRLAD